MRRRGGAARRSRFWSAERRRPSRWWSRSRTGTASRFTATWRGRGTGGWGGRAGVRRPETSSRQKPQALREAESRGIPIYVLRSNTLLQMQQALLSLQGKGQDPVVEAMTEAEEAIHAVMAHDRPVERSPR